LDHNVQLAIVAYTCTGKLHSSHQAALRKFSKVDFLLHNYLPRRHKVMGTKYNDAQVQFMYQVLLAVVPLES